MQKDFCNTIVQKRTDTGKGWNGKRHTRALQRKRLCDASGASPAVPAEAPTSKAATYFNVAKYRMRTSSSM